MAQTVLCIDDEERGLSIRKLLLESSGFSALTATSGEEGLRIFRDRPIDAAIVDYAMPGMDGATVSTQMKQTRPRMPVIMLSGYPSYRDAVSGVVDAFLVKGDDPENLLRKVKSLTRIRSHAHPELQSEYVIFADQDRHYLDCSDGICQLLGYSRASILDMMTEDLSYDPELMSVFEQFSATGAPEGEFLLKDASGTPVRVRYKSYVFLDGCMASVWTPLGASGRGIHT